MLAFSAVSMAPGHTFPATDGAVSSAQGAEGPVDPVAGLMAELASGGRPLAFTPLAQGYAPDLLRRLKIEDDSQVLVFSKTSLQQGFIGPATPRAIYFNDTVALGYIPGAPLIEMWAVGRDGALRFYTVKNTQGVGALPKPESDECKVCHAGLHPAAPGPVMMSVSTRPNGIVSHYDLFTDGRTPIAERWGGWYVTGRHGEMRHKGNVAADVPEAAAIQDGQNLVSLAGKFDPGRYARPTSDIVALMTLEHETGFLNIAGDIQARVAFHSDPATIDKAVGELADYMLGIDGAVLTAPVEGTSGFAERFAAEGPKDGNGRGLRDLDLRGRLFRYPLSYMIYSPAFDALPPEAKDKLYRRLADVLTGRDRSARYQSLSPADRAAAFDIVAATKPGLPAFWRRDVSQADLAR
ncbi:MAG: hypothetical protein WCI21_04765 [Alphaproteobacteria bacterium]